MVPQICMFSGHTHVILPTNCIWLYWNTTCFSSVSSVKANEYSLGTNLSLLVTTTVLQIASQQVMGFLCHCPKYNFCLFGDVNWAWWKRLEFVFVFHRTLCSLLKADTDVNHFPQQWGESIPARSVALRNLLMWFKLMLWRVDKRAAYGWANVPGPGSELVQDLACLPALGSLTQQLKPHSYSTCRQLLSWVTWEMVKSLLDPLWSPFWPRWWELWSLNYKTSTAIMLGVRLHWCGHPVQ